MSLTIRFRAAARNDLVALGAYGRREWGVIRSRKYLQQIAARIRELADYPELGPPAEIEPANLRKLKSGRHLILYIFNDAEIEIVRVLHEQMDIPQQLG